VESRARPLAAAFADRALDSASLVDQLGAPQRRLAATFKRYSKPSDLPRYLNAA
jgi:hypothetical protein